MASILMSPSFLALVLSLLFCNLMPSHATETDIYCLKSVKSSVEDPFGYLKSWNFRNNTEGSICKFRGVGCWHDDENKVINLKLADMGLRGKFPLGLSNCTSLTGLDLSGNNFSGPIPSNIDGILLFVTSLNLSSNNFSGEIPAGIGNMSYLNFLQMNNNRLTGQIPAQLGSLPRLRSFSVANNLLLGKVPEFHMASIPFPVSAYKVSPFLASSFAGNPGLCGPPLGPCSHRKLPIQFIGGFTAGYVLCFHLSVVGFILFSKPNMPKKKRRKEKQVIDGELGLLRINMSSTSNNTKILKLEKLVARMTLTEIKRATNNFSHHGVISVGKTGTMHKAMLLSGQLLAIKKLYHNQPFDDHFMNVAMILSTLTHPNLVPLFGFCIEASEKLLVYTYMSNQNLHHWLHPPNQAHSISLDWPSRLKIAIGVARGLTWLHNNPHFQVLHLNITSKSILLDHNLRPKISSFGNAKLTNRGGATEMKDSGFLHKDVHDFGVVLLEMITGKEASASGESISIDKSLVGRGFDGEIHELFRIACSCVEPSSDRKLTMLQVFEGIRSIGKSHKPEGHSQTWVPCEASIASGRDGEIEEIGESVSQVFYARGSANGATHLLARQCLVRRTGPWGGVCPVRVWCCFF